MLDETIKIMTSQDKDKAHTHYTLDADHTLYMDFFHGRRNTSFYDEDINTIIRHRFTGHTSLKANNMGIETFFKEM